MTVASYLIWLPVRVIRSITSLSGLVYQPGQPIHSWPLKSTVLMTNVSPSQWPTEWPNQVPSQASIGG